MTRIAVWVVTIVVFLASVAQAAPKKADGAATKEAAREEWRQGNAAYNLGHYDEAIQRFEAAYKLVPDATFLFNIAQSYRMSGQPEKAIDRYRAFLRTATEEDTNREIAKKWVEELKQEMERKAEAKREVAAPPFAAAPVEASAAPAAAPSAPAEAPPAPAAAVPRSSRR
jgi:tetratricopeptide (TPR) repeat protein